MAGGEWTVAGDVRVVSARRARLEGAELEREQSQALQGLAECECMTVAEARAALGLPHPRAAWDSGNCVIRQCCLHSPGLSALLAALVEGVWPPFGP